MTRPLTLVAIAAAIAIAASSGAWAETAANVNSAIINDVKVTGVSAAPVSASPPSSASVGAAKLDLLNKLRDAVPVMPTLSMPLPNDLRG